MKSRQRVLYALGEEAIYHPYANCPLATEIEKDRRRIATERTAQDKGMQRCPTCVLMDAPFEKRREDLPRGVGVEPTAKIGVALSGGGHRATLFGLGVLMYLVRARRDDGTSVNNDVLEISSVSGGSFANGYVAQSLDYQWATPESFDKVAGELASQIAQRGTLFAPWWARVYVAVLVTLSVLALGGLASAFLIRNSWSSFWLAVTVASLALTFVVGLLAQLRGAICERSLADTLFSPDG